MGESRGIKPGDLCRVNRRCLGFIIEGDSLSVQPDDTLHGGYGRRTTSLDDSDTVLVISLHGDDSAIVTLEGELILIAGDTIESLSEAPNTSKE